MAVMGALVPGCVNKPVCVEVCEDCENSEFFFENQLAWLSPVTIVPVPTDATDPQILTAFCTELATALRDRGVADVTIRGDDRQHCESKLPEVPPAPVRELSSLLMFVAIPDYRAFRPMRMAVDVRLVQPENEQELIRIVDVFVGPQETPLRETPREIRLFRDRKREETADREAYTAFHTNSPRWFLTNNAHRVTDRLSYLEPPVSAAGSAAIPPVPLPRLSVEPSPLPNEVPSLPSFPSVLPGDTRTPPKEPPRFPFLPPALMKEPTPLLQEAPTFPDMPPPLPSESATTPDAPGIPPRPAPRPNEEDDSSVPYALLS